MRSFLTRFLKRQRPWASLLGYGVALVLIACAQRILPPTNHPPSSDANSTQNTTLLVAAAASLQTVLQAIDPLYRQAHPNHSLTYNFAASGALQRQIEQGAPVDIFISAALSQMDALQEQELLEPDSRINLLTNRLVLVIPKNSATRPTEFEQLTQPDVQRIAMGEPRSVPAGQYAEQVLRNLGILDQVQAKLVLGNNVTSVLTAVETGDVDAGLVYSTDAQRSDKIEVVAIADSALHSPILYPAAIARASQGKAAAAQYLEFLQRDGAVHLFKQAGFGMAAP
jgi:molybdate transport system substrate-binding protein